MSRYGFLVSPSHNRVYARSAPALALAELEAFGETVIDGGVQDTGVTEIGGVPYVTFSAAELSGSYLRCVFVESEPLLKRTLAWRIADAHDGRVAAGELSVERLRARQPWSAE